MKPWSIEGATPLVCRIAEERIATFGAQVVAMQSKIALEALGRWLGVEPDIESVAPHRHRLSSYRVGNCTHYYIDQQLVVSVWDGSAVHVTRERADVAYVDEWQFHYKDYSK